ADTACNEPATSSSTRPVVPRWLPATSALLSVTVPKTLMPPPLSPALSLSLSDLLKTMVELVMTAVPARNRPPPECAAWLPVRVLLTRRKVPRLFWEIGPPRLSRAAPPVVELLFKVESSTVRLPALKMPPPSQLFPVLELLDTVQATRVRLAPA